MSCIKDVPTLRGDNYSEWRKKVDLAFVCAEVDWVVDTPQPVKPKEPERAAADDDTVREIFHVPLRGNHYSSFSYSPAHSLRNHHVRL